MKVVCYGCGPNRTPWRRTKNVLKNNKNNKDKKKVTMQIYVAREDESEESEPYGGFTIQARKEKKQDSRNKSQEEEKVWMHTYRTEEFKEDFEEIEESDKEDQLTEEK